MSPLHRAIALATSVLTLIAGGGVLTGLWLPDANGTMRALLVVTVLFAATLAIAPRFGSWSDLGVNRPADWHRCRLLLVPSAVAVSPLVLGVELPAANSVWVLVVGYALTGVTEELLWRGICQRVLAPLGPARSVLVAAALFGTVHLGNVFFRDNVALVLAQAWGAFCFGVGYGAVRARIHTIVPLMVLHGVTDLAAAIGALSKIPMLVAEDVVLLTLGVLVLRQSSLRGPRRAAVAAS